MYHVNKKMQVVECKKEEGKCSLDPHFEEFEDAQSHADQEMSKEFSFTPNVIYANNIPDEIVIDYLTHNRSELYVVAQYLKHEINPIIIVGQNINDEAQYHCLFENDGLYQDINGVIAWDIDQLDEYMRDTYNLLEEPYARIEQPKSIEMIESLLGFQLDDYNTRGRLVSMLTKELEQAKTNKEKDKYYSLLYIMKELT